MNRIGMSALLILASSVLSAQTTNCLVLAGGVVKCSDPQGLGPATPTTNCQMSNGMMRCSQPQTVQPASPPPAPQSMPNYRAAPLPAPQPSFQQPQPTPEVAQQRWLQEQEIEKANDRPAPDETTLKAAYCSGVISNSVGRMKSNVDAITSDPHVDPGSKAEVQTMLDKDNLALNRVNSYIYPRVSSVDPAPLLAAKKQGYDDFSRVRQETEKCYAQCQSEANATVPATTSCMMQCNAGSEAYQHTKMCNGLGFLPY